MGRLDGKRIAFLVPEFLRMDDDAVAFARAFFEQAEPVGVICHGPWTLVEADVVRGRRLASWPSVKTDIRNAEELCEGRHEGQARGVGASAS